MDEWDIIERENKSWFNLSQEIAILKQKINTVEQALKTAINELRIMQDQIFEHQVDIQVICDNHAIQDPSRQP